MTLPAPDAGTLPAYSGDGLRPTEERSDSCRPRTVLQFVAWSLTCLVEVLSIEARRLWADVAAAIGKAGFKSESLDNRGTGGDGSASE